ncbi:hypothetical protein NQ315_016502 [Exocentrus adspersus]|uniref:GIY-YIG domain-containing protein n=1 Tax=Exocentrus adspersus TaxID=1586481 RepID=A0AAV8VZB8_9CUCU|nr:hypothetical protein NQ315_016502 [Exocentrus adspersus]
MDNESNHLRTALSCYRYLSRDIERAIKTRPNIREEGEFSLYCEDRSASEEMEHQHQIHYHEEDIASELIKMLNIYTLRGTKAQKLYYAGWCTGRHVSTRLKEHKSGVKKNNFEKSAVEEHRAGTGHAVELET